MQYCNAFLLKITKELLDRQIISRENLGNFWICNFSKKWAQVWTITVFVPILWNSNINAKCASFIAGTRVSGNHVSVFLWCVNGQRSDRTDLVCKWVSVDAVRHDNKRPTSSDFVWMKTKKIQIFFNEYAVICVYMCVLKNVCLHAYLLNTHLIPAFKVTIHMSCGCAL